MPKLKKRADGRYMLQRRYNGKTVSFYGKTEAEVRKKIAAYEERLRAPETYREIAQAWYDDVWDTFAPGTQNGYRMSYLRALDEFDGMLASEVTPQDVSVLLNKLIGQSYSSKMIKTQKTVISTIYRHAIEHGVRVSNPTSALRVPRGLPKQTRLPPSDEDIRKVMETDDEWLFPRLLLYTGLRRGEALALTYEDIDRERKTITVNKEIIFKSNSPILVDRTKTAAGTRKVLLPDVLASLLPDNGHGRIFELTYRTFKTQLAHY